ncbi:MAG TPA: YgjV family protein [Chloroflexi bacterium]|mgnify:FL=1|nr:YgjV family protein [Chloroflexota bacterium]HPO58544.1 hypothetical protein [Anaerolineaceae bacterium]
MEPSLIYEIIGYIASVLIAVSLMMTSILRLRVINLIGAVFFTVYGLLVRAYPVAAVNFFIVLVDLYFLYEIIRTKEYFTLLEVRPDSAYLLRFLDFYQKEIQRFLPGFSYQPGQAGLVFFVLRNMVPAGVFIGRVEPDGRLFVALDFVIPGYRDFKVGDYVYRQHAGLFRRHGVRRIYSRPGSPRHETYLRRMGFQPDGAAQGERTYYLDLPAAEVSAA